MAAAPLRVEMATFSARLSGTPARKTALPITKTSCRRARFLLNCDLRAYAMHQGACCGRHVHRVIARRRMTGWTVVDATTRPPHHEEHSQSQDRKARECSPALHPARPGASQDHPDGHKGENPAKWRLGPSESDRWDAAG